MKKAYEDDVVEIPDILKAHRLDLMAKYGAYSVPFADDELMDAFKDQVLCSQNFYAQPRLVVFIHDYGSLRAELDGVMHVDLNLERSYMLDATRKLVEWASSQEFSLIDINVFPHKLKQGTPEADLLKRLIIYLWDNYIDQREFLSVARAAADYTTYVRRIMVDIIPVDKRVSAFVQIVGTLEPTRVPLTQPELRRWFIERSLVIIPESHPTRFTGKWVKNCGVVEAT
ncbi:Histone deacetylase hda1, partial [Tulasnella sp. 417]